MSRLTDHEYAIARTVPDVLLHILQLQPWSIDFVWGPPPKRDDDDDDGDGNTLGECSADPLYTNATIYVDIDSCGELEEVVRTIRHEMLHVVGAEFTTMVSMVGQFVPEGGQMNIVHEAYRQSSERFVRHMESAMEHGIKGGDITSLIREAKRRIREDER